MTDRIDEEIVSTVKALVDAGDLDGLQALLQPMHAVDVADILEIVDDGEKVIVLKALGNERAAEVLSEVDEKSGQALLELLTDKEVVNLIEEMPSDDAADIISQLPPEKSEQIESLLSSQERVRISELLEFEEDTAGGIMEVEKLAVREDASIRDAIRLVRERAEEIENIQKVFVVDGRGVLKGAINVLDLLIHEPSEKIADVMEKNVISVPVGMDQEEVAGIFARYDEFTLPVVDEQGVLKGRITVDDIIDVIEEEASEDIAKLAGTDENEIGERSPVKISRSRLPWLIGGMLGELINAVLISRYEVSLNTAVTLVFFIPLLIGTAGNTGSQAAVVVVRELALKEIAIGRTWRRIFKELQVALINGFILGAILFTFVNIWRHEAGLGMLMWVSLVSVVMVAAFMGASVPLLLNRLKIDPAIATGPFISVSNDIVGLAIYLALATHYLSIMGGK
jgi:magnesium transporter